MTQNADLLWEAVVGLAGFIAAYLPTSVLFALRRQIGEAVALRCSRLRGRRLGRGPVEGSGKPHGTEAVNDVTNVGRNVGNDVDTTARNDGAGTQVEAEVRVEPEGQQMAAQYPPTNPFAGVQPTNPFVY